MADYDVVLLVETGLSDLDVRQVRSLHTALPDPVTYHVLLPVEDAAVRVQAAVGALNAGGGQIPPTEIFRAEDVSELQDEMVQECRAQLDATVKRFEDSGATAEGELVSVDPVDGLATKVGQVEAAEVIVLTSSHTVQEFFHLDWASQARRRLGVPVLHLLERETFDEQAESFGDGVTGL